ncbi:MAG: FAD-dependent oxidoreductase [Terriglobales bacterium]
MSTPDCEIAIIGAGPYGLSAAAHLRAAGADVHVFGRLLEFWKQHMPVGMLLRSGWKASSIAGPGGSLSLDEFQRQHNRTLPRPLPLESFVAYGHWVQAQAAIDVDPDLVDSVQARGARFELRLQSGRRFLTRRVVVAGGLAPFPLIPQQFRGLPQSLASHSSEHRHFSRFRDKRVAVVGGGQSALESAALLRECGADVELLVRAPSVIWIHKREWILEHLALLASLLYPPTDVGPPFLNQIVARPDFFKVLPPEWRARIAHRCIRPAGAAWLLPRIAGVTITNGITVEAAESKGDQVALRLTDGSTRTVDHVVLATGYAVNIAKYPFLPSALTQQVERVNGYPRLRPSFESSVPGLHFIGASAAWNFGPLMRFVCGTAYTSRALTQHIRGRRISYESPALRATRPHASGSASMGR